MEGDVALRQHLPGMVFGRKERGKPWSFDSCMMFATDDVYDVDDKLKKMFNATKRVPPQQIR